MPLINWELLNNKEYFLTGVRLLHKYDKKLKLLGIRDWKTDINEQPATVLFKVDTTATHNNDKKVNNKRSATKRSPKRCLCAIL